MKVRHLKLSHTSLSAFRASPRNFYYSYVLGLRPKGDKQSPSLLFGQAFHRVMELSVRAGVVTPEVEAAVMQEYPEQAAQALETARQFLLVSDIKPEAVIATELELAIPLTNKLTYLAHLDLLLREPDGSVSVVDYKTTSKHLFYGWAPMLLPSQQGIGYVVAAQEAGYNCDKIVFQGVSSDHKLLNPEYVPRKRTGELAQRPPQFLQVPFYVEPYHKDRWWAGVVADACRMIDRIEDGLEAAPCTCTSGRDTCPFRSLCMAPPGAPIDDTQFDRSDFRGFVLDIEDDAC